MAIYICRPLASLLIAVSAFAEIPAGAAPATFRMDPNQSFVRIHVGKTGLFSFAGDEHHVHAPVAEGIVAWDPEDVAASSAEVTFAMDQVRVDDPEFADAKRRQIQERMDGALVLDVATHPTASFRSTGVRRKADGHLEVAGELTLLGRSRPITLDVDVRSTSPRFVARATTRFKLTLFNIEPVSAAAGTVKVKDEMELEVEVTAVPVP